MRRSFLDRAGLNHLVGVAILLVVVCGALLLRERRLGTVIMLLGGVMAAGVDRVSLLQWVNRVDDQLEVLENETPPSSEAAREG